MIVALPCILTILINFSLSQVIDSIPGPEPIRFYDDAENLHLFVDEAGVLRERYEEIMTF